MTTKRLSKNIPKGKGRVVYNETPRDEDNYSATPLKEWQDENGKVLATWNGKEWEHNVYGYYYYDDKTRWVDDNGEAIESDSLENENHEKEWFKDGKLFAIWDESCEAWMQPFPQKDLDDEAAYREDMELYEAMRRLSEEQQRERKSERKTVVSFKF
jgi:hypothetical protein